MSFVIIKEALKANCTRPNYQNTSFFIHDLNRSFTMGTPVNILKIYSE